jgi:hypothetical protein
VSAERQVAQTQYSFRDLNERVAEGRKPDGWFVFVCECSRPDCVNDFALTLEEYRKARSTPDRFALFPGHERPELERVVERLDRCVIVEKLGDSSGEGWSGLATSDSC